MFEIREIDGVRYMGYAFVRQDRFEPFMCFGAMFTDHPEGERLFKEGVPLANQGLGVDKVSAKEMGVPLEDVKGLGVRVFVSELLNASNKYKQPLNGKYEVPNDEIIKEIVEDYYA